MTESGFVRVSSNPKVLPSPIGVETAASARAPLVMRARRVGHLKRAPG
jgi:hypothetical protein